MLLGLTLGTGCPVVTPKYGAPATDTVEDTEPDADTDADADESGDTGAR